MNEHERVKLRDHLAGIIVEHQPKPIPINVGEAQYIADGIVNRLFAALEERHPATDDHNDPGQFVIDIAARRFITEYLKVV